MPPVGFEPTISEGKRPQGEFAVIIFHQLRLYCIEKETRGNAENCSQCSADLSRSSCMQSLFIALSIVN